MPYYFDQWGWLSAKPIPGRETNVVPPDNIPEGMAANFTGYEWKVLHYSPPPVSPPEPLPNPTRRQIKLALLSLGLLDEVEAAVFASGDRVLQINYEDATEFERSSDLVVGLANALGKSDEEIDAIWSLARTL